MAAVFFALISTIAIGAAGWFIYATTHIGGRKIFAGTAFAVLIVMAAASCSVQAAPVRPLSPLPPVEVCRPRVLFKCQARLVSLDAAQPLRQQATVGSAALPREMWRPTERKEGWRRKKRR